MKIKATHAFGVAGKLVISGETVEVHETLARELVHRGRAVHIAAEPEPDGEADKPASKPAKK